MDILDFLMAPFADYAFMRRALVSGVILALGAAPLGVFMMLRRMTLVGDALAHAMLPGIALAFLVAGLSVWALTLGGLAMAVGVAALASVLVRKGRMKEDSAFSMLYLICLAAGVSLLSLQGGSVNLLHLLFGDVLAVDRETLALVTGISCVTLLTLAVLYRRLVIGGFDPDFLRVASGGRGGGVDLAFFVLLALNLVAAFQAMGTLMALGLMILPALAAHRWAKTVDGMIPLAMVVAALSVWIGLLISYYSQIPSGPAIVLVAGGFALLSVARKKA